MEWESGMDVSLGSASSSRETAAEASDGSSSSGDGQLYSSGGVVYVLPQKSAGGNGIWSRAQLGSGSSSGGGGAGGVRGSSEWSRRQPELAPPPAGAVAGNTGFRSRFWIRQQPAILAIEAPEATPTNSILSHADKDDGLTIAGPATPPLLMITGPTSSSSSSSGGSRENHGADGSLDASGLVGFPGGILLAWDTVILLVLAVLAFAALVATLAVKYAQRAHLVKSDARPQVNDGIGAHTTAANPAGSLTHAETEATRTSDMTLQAVAAAGMNQRSMSMPSIAAQNILLPKVAQGMDEHGQWLIGEGREVLESKSSSPAHRTNGTSLPSSPNLKPQKNITPPLLSSSPGLKPTSASAKLSPKLSPKPSPKLLPYLSPHPGLHGRPSKGGSGGEGGAMISNDAEEQWEALQAINADVTSRWPIPMRRYRDEFEEVGRLGEGGFGAVFQCRNRLDGTDYAIKKVKLSSKHPDKIEKVLREVRILAKLDNKHIIRYYQAWIEPITRSEQEAMAAERRSARDRSFGGNTNGNDTREDGDSYSQRERRRRPRRDQSSTGPSSTADTTVESTTVGRQPVLPGQREGGGDVGAADDDFFNFQLDAPDSSEGQQHQLQPPHLPRRSSADQPLYDDVSALGMSREVSFADDTQDLSTSNRRRHHTWNEGGRGERGGVRERQWSYESGSSLDASSQQLHGVSSFGDLSQEDGSSAHRYYRRHSHRRRNRHRLTPASDSNRNGLSGPSGGGGKMVWRGQWGSCNSLNSNGSLGGSVASLNRRQQRHRLWSGDKSWGGGSTEGGSSVGHGIDEAMHNIDNDDDNGDGGWNELAEWTGDNAALIAAHAAQDDREDMVLGGADDGYDDDVSEGKAGARLVTNKVAAASSSVLLLSEADGDAHSNSQPQEQTIAAKATVTTPEAVGIAGLERIGWSPEQRGQDGLSGGDDTSSPSQLVQLSPVRPRQTSCDDDDDEEGNRLVPSPPMSPQGNNSFVGGAGDEGVAANGQTKGHYPALLRGTSASSGMEFPSPLSLDATGDVEEEVGEDDKRQKSKLQQEHSRKRRYRNVWRGESDSSGGSVGSWSDEAGLHEESDDDYDDEDLSTASSDSLSGSSSCSDSDGDGSGSDSTAEDFHIGDGDESKLESTAAGLVTVPEGSPKRASMVGSNGRVADSLEDQSASTLSSSGMASPSRGGSHLQHSQHNGAGGGVLSNLGTSVDAASLLPPLSAAAAPQAVLDSASSAENGEAKPHSEAKKLLRNQRRRDNQQRRPNSYSSGLSSRRRRDGRRSGGGSSISSSSRTTKSSDAPYDLWLYIQMQYCSGNTLREWLDERGSEVDIGQSLQVFSQIARGLEYVHGEAMIQ